MRLELDGESRPGKTLAMAYALLARRARGEGELRAKLRQKGAEEGAINEAVAILKENGYLNDDQYARQVARRLAVDRGLGNRAIVAKLKEKGLDPELINSALAEVREELTEVEAIGRYIDKETKKSPLWDMARKRRVANRLIGRGHEAGLVWEIIRESGENDDDDGK